MTAKKAAAKPAKAPKPAAPKAPAVIYRDARTGETVDAEYHAAHPYRTHRIEASE